MTKAQSTEQKFNALLELIGDSQLTSAQIADRGGCILVDGVRESLRYYLEKMVEIGLLEKVKAKAARRPVGAKQFADHSCKHTYRKAKAE